MIKTYQHTLSFRTRAASKQDNTIRLSINKRHGSRRVNKSIDGGETCIVYKAIRPNNRNLTTASMWPLGGDVASGGRFHRPAASPVLCSLLVEPYIGSASLHM